ncbi:MAG: response regulator [Spirochaetaceae bacterium]|jgi:CheY-like chemotaxis protein|nr:response regulator [Spirochaetaceae bacterium]
MSKIYIIDDDRDIVDALTMVLESEDHEIASQNDEDNAVGNVIDFGAELIILDVIFPENDGAGFEIARKLKHNEKTKNIPIAMVSAVNEKGQYSGTFSNADKDDVYLPVDEFVEKPLVPADLIKLVNKLLN